MENLLKPCPFCGNHDIRVAYFPLILNQEEENNWRVKYRIEMICELCNLVLAFDYTGNICETGKNVLIAAKNAAVKKWNTRF